MALSSSEHAIGRHGTGASGSTRTPAADPSVGELVGEISEDFSRLVRSEIELAKAEITQEATRAGKAGGMLAGSGYAGHLVLLMGSLAAVFGLAHLVDLAWAALIVTAVWAVVGAVLFVVGRARMRAVRVKPERTAETLKEDAQWVRTRRS
ncbi:phage holin family protein [Streptomyces sp. A0642]|uniref:phage holin family protein n=1 Tax=unclassified Streptomyces TaxID=2593676 RepID=UPI0010A2599F|nr:phage holin family protein [Streptomyces sp. A0642]THA77496.1 phage holin family protein [Streptomyces sp. A0642]